MKLEDARKMAGELLERHGLDEWHFHMNGRYKTRFGNCNCRDKVISISSRLTKLNSEEEVRNTILHEIAHALTPNHGHDKMWKMKAKQIGCDAERCYSRNEVITPPRKSYTYECLNCGRTHKRYKKTYKLACRKCCDKYNNGEYSKEYIIKLKKD